MAELSNVSGMLKIKDLYFIFVQNFVPLPIKKPRKSIEHGCKLCVFLKCANT